MVDSFQDSSSAQVTSIDQDSVQMSLTSRPRNTTKQYEPKQVEFRDFCREKGYSDGDIVTEEKLDAFLTERVMGRAARKSRHYQERTDENGEPVVQTLGLASIKAYKSAIVSLWNYQRSQGINPHGHPVGASVKALLDNHAKQETQRKKSTTQYADRGAGPIISETAPMADTHAEPPYELRMWESMVADQLRVIRQDIREVSQQLQIVQNTVESGLQKLSHQLRDLINGRIPMAPRPTAPGQGLAGAGPATTAAETNDGLVPGNGDFTAMRGSGMDELGGAIETLAGIIQPVSGQSAATSDESGSGHGTRLPRTYRLSRTIKTVPELWREWTEGLNGGPSVQSLDAVYGAKWRVEQAERMFYSRRKVIIDDIFKRQKSKGGSLNAAVAEVELLRQDRNLSLNALAKVLKESDRWSRASSQANMDSAAGRDDRRPGTDVEV
ncbi:hypothetical protein VTN49DRAFT_6706 [Thermomyces lanuginosus]|uniref:uncharacterized protein n=1 Tax=Thermomyces lanuginosus TaxID=5541 RepID=UPI0037423466